MTSKKVVEIFNYQAILKFVNFLMSMIDFALEIHFILSNLNRNSWYVIKVAI